MHRPFLLMGFGVAVAAACSSGDKTSGPTSSPGTTSTGTMSSTDPVTSTDPMNGQTGSIGAAVCLNDADCASKIAEMLDPLRSPVHTDRHVIGSECLDRAHADPGQFFAHTTVCACYYGASESDPRTVATALPLGIKPACNVEGRSLDCLSSCSDFAGCDLADKASCDAPCAALASLINQDNAKSFDVEIRYTKCGPGGGSCDAVFRIDDRCYTSHSYGMKAYNCALSNDAILAADSVPPPTDNMAMQIDPNLPNWCQDTSKN